MKELSAHVDSVYIKGYNDGIVMAKTLGKSFTQFFTARQRSLNRESAYYSGFDAGFIEHIKTYQRNLSTNNLTETMKLNLPSKKSKGNSSFER